MRDNLSEFRGRGVENILTPKTAVEEYAISPSFHPHCYPEMKEQQGGRILPLWIRGTQKKSSERRREVLI